MAESLFPQAQVRARVAANPIETLLTFLASPDVEDWRQEVRAAALAWARHASNTRQVEAVGRIADPDAAVAGWVADGTLDDDPAQPDSNVAFAVRSDGGLRVLLAVINPPSGRISLGAVVKESSTKGLCGAQRLAEAAAENRRRVDGVGCRRSWCLVPRHGP